MPFLQVLEPFLIEFSVLKLHQFVGLGNAFMFSVAANLENAIVESVLHFKVQLDSYAQCLSDYPKTYSSFAYF